MWAPFFPFYVLLAVVRLSHNVKKCLGRGDPKETFGGEARGAQIAGGVG